MALWRTFSEQWHTSKLPELLSDQATKKITSLANFDKNCKKIYGLVQSFQQTAVHIRVTSIPASENSKEERVKNRNRRTHFGVVEVSKLLQLHQRFVEVMQRDLRHCGGHALSRGCRLHGFSGEDLSLCASLLDQRLNHPATLLVHLAECDLVHFYHRCVCVCVCEQNMWWAACS